MCFFWQRQSVLHCVKRKANSQCFAHLLSFSLSHLFSLFLSASLSLSLSLSLRRSLCLFFFVSLSFFFSHAVTQSPYVVWTALSWSVLGVPDTEKPQIGIRRQDVLMLHCSVEDETRVAPFWATNNLPQKSAVVQPSRFRWGRGTEDVSEPFLGQFVRRLPWTKLQNGNHCAGKVDGMFQWWPGVGEHQLFLLRWVKVLVEHYTICQGHENISVLFSASRFSRLDLSPWN